MGDTDLAWEFGVAFLKEMISQLKPEEIHWERECNDYVLQKEESASINSLT